MLLPATTLYAKISITITSSSQMPLASSTPMGTFHMEWVLHCTFLSLNYLWLLGQPPPNMTQQQCEVMEFIVPTLKQAVIAG